MERNLRLISDAWSLVLAIAPGLMLFIASPVFLGCHGIAAKHWHALRSFGSLLLLLQTLHAHCSSTDQTSF